MFALGALEHFMVRLDMDDYFMFWMVRIFLAYVEILIERNMQASEKLVTSVHRFSEVAGSQVAASSSSTYNATDAAFGHFC